MAVVLIHYGATRLPGKLGWQSMQCPFTSDKHKDRNASGRVNLDLNAYKCLACQISGDPIKIIRIQEGCSFAEAVEFARTVFDASVERVSRSVPKRAKSKKLGSGRWKEILD